MQAKVLDTGIWVLGNWDIEFGSDEIVIFGIPDSPYNNASS